VKTLIQSIVLTLVLFAASNFAQTADSMKVLTDYSLFSEYHKNKDFASALSYGWSVIEANPTKFSKWIYYKMEECFWGLHDSSSTPPEMVKSIQDTILYFYDTAIKYRPEDKGYFQARKAYVSELWLSQPASVTIPAYEQAIAWQPELSSFYYDRLGKLYINNDDGTNGLKEKAIDLYTILVEREPDNPVWGNIITDLFGNIDDRLKFQKDAWEKDPQNEKKAKAFASTAIQASEWAMAVAPLEFLLTLEPENIGYLTQIGNVYNKIENTTKSEETFSKLIKLEPNNKDHYFYFGKALMEAGKYSQARTQFLKASEVGSGWALPIFYEGFLYEQSAGGCTDFDRKVVYLLAQQTYRKALNMDPSLSEAKDRINALSGAVPTKEDYFFRGIKSGQTLTITCVGWIGKSVTAP
jgi:tetratricopeptide (TPR) repeat protein